MQDPAFIGCRTVKGDCPALEEYLSLLGARPRKGITRGRITQLATVFEQHFRVPGLLRASGSDRQKEIGSGGAYGGRRADLLTVAEFLEFDCLAPADLTPSSDCSVRTPKLEGSSWPGWACCGASPLQLRANPLFAASG